MANERIWAPWRLEYVKDAAKDSETDCIFCACHEGYYDTAGQVISGPPPQPLRPLFSKPQNGKLVIALEKENLEKAS